MLRIVVFACLPPSFAFGSPICAELTKLREELREASLALASGGAILGSTVALYQISDAISEELARELSKQAEKLLEQSSGSLNALNEHAHTYPNMCR